MLTVSRLHRLERITHPWLRSLQKPRLRNNFQQDKSRPNSPRLNDQIRQRPRLQ